MGFLKPKSNNIGQNYSYLYPSLPISSGRIGWSFEAKYNIKN